MGLSLHHGGSFPVGKVDRLTLRPMSFVEFVRAVSGDLLADALLRADVDLLTASDDLLGQRLKEYFVIGGMPEVVDSFRRDRDVTECRRLQLQVLSDYDGDFGKHVPTRILERLRLALEVASRAARAREQEVRVRCCPGECPCAGLRGEPSVAEGLWCRVQGPSRLHVAISAQRLRKCIGIQAVLRGRGAPWCPSWLGPFSCPWRVEPLYRVQGSDDRAVCRTGAVRSGAFACLLVIEHRKRRG